VNLPPGVHLRRLAPHPDRRGWLVEAFRAEWEPNFASAQVNLSSSAPGVLRGSHVHGRHTDYFVLAAGAATVGLKDLRWKSPTFGHTWLVRLEAERPEALIVPPGVLHGLYFAVPSLLVSVESEPYDPTEEIRCRWDDSQLGIAWPFAAPILSDDDRRAVSFAEAMRALEPWQASFRIAASR
jgi:dTDP-4-dehydrorhamnose 3,5-epimerase